MARVIGKPPGVIGATHNGATYCVDCAIEHTPATEDRLKNDGMRDLPWTGALIGFTGTRHCHDCGSDHYHCDVCGDELPRRKR